MMFDCWMLWVSKWPYHSREVHGWKQTSGPLTMQSDFGVLWGSIPETPPYPTLDAKSMGNLIHGWIHTGPPDVTGDVLWLHLEVFWSCARLQKVSCMETNILLPCPGAQVWASVVDSESCFKINLWVPNIWIRSADLYFMLEVWDWPRLEPVAYE